MTATTTNNYNNLIPCNWIIFCLTMAVGSPLCHQNCLLNMSLSTELLKQLLLRSCTAETLSWPKLPGAETSISLPAGCWVPSVDRQCCCQLCIPDGQQSSLKMHQSRALLFAWAKGGCTANDSASRVCGFGKKWIILKPLGILGEINVAFFIESNVEN